MSKMKEYSLTLLLVIALVLSLSTNALASPEACCFPDLSCVMMEPSDCLGIGGTPAGPGSDCRDEPCESAQGKEFGDAPEGSLAYPSTGVFGAFPTCIGVGLAAWIEHDNFGAWFGPSFDFESDGNAGFCPLFDPFTYDMDECFADGDAGLLFPDSFTITGPLLGETVVPCAGAGGSSLGSTCGTAVWGTDIDIDVTNIMPGATIGFVNVLIDWSQDGVWGGSSTCPGAPAPEHVLVNHPIPNPYSGPLSALLPPGFVIGPKSGYVWARFTITNVPVPPGWTGDGIWEDGETEDYLLHVQGDTAPQQWDWGDAPDTLAALIYPTLSIHAGASHLIVPGGPYFDDGTFLDFPDPEPDGQPNGSATGDDTLDGSDDEDGVMIPILTTGTLATITFDLPVGGCVDAWIDFDSSGSWSAAEKIIATCYPVGSHAVTITVPAGAIPGSTFARFRVSSPPGGLLPTGPAFDGEVEDHRVLIQAPPEPERDWGDAPDSFIAPLYPTLALHGGANHIIGGPYFDDSAFSGDVPDAEPDGLPDPTATGDDLAGIPDDEDGISIPPLVKGSTVTILLYLPLGGCVDAWIDFDASGSWDAVEALAPACYPAGVSPMVIPVPSSAVAGPTFARFRISSIGGLPPTGPASDGEVEDIEVLIEEAQGNTKLKFQQLPLDGPFYFGHDELSVAYLVYDLIQVPAFPIGYQGCYMADDFADLENTPVRRIKWWGSYMYNEIIQPIDKFEIAFESDIPADPLGIPSHPDQLLSSQVVHLAPAGAVLSPGEYSETKISSGGPPCFEDLYEYEAVLADPFPEQSDTVYWLKIVALVDLTDIEAATIQDIIDTDPLIDNYCEYIRQIDLPDPPLTRWGWHNRDYEKMDPFASTPPAVTPGESIIGTIINPAGLAVDIWHFQDDAVEGDVWIDMLLPWDPAFPDSWMVIQPTWRETYYKYSPPFCSIPVPPIGADGPHHIALYSKDLAFELYTNKYPPCWDSLTQCHGDASSATWNVSDGQVDNWDWIPFRDGYLHSITDVPNTKYMFNICADNTRDGAIDNFDWINFRNNYLKGPVPVNCPPGDINGVFP